VIGTVRQELFAVIVTFLSELESMKSSVDIIIVSKLITVEAPLFNYDFEVKSSR
jgi:hypothetical protein